MSAENRLLPDVTCYSPEGNAHIGKFISSNDPQGKTLAQLKTVGGNFGRVQDLGTNLRTMNFIIYFDGSDHDLLSEAFIKSLKEKGPWSIDHPVRGRLTDQYPALFDPTIDPVGSGNITAVATAWVKDYPEDEQISQIQRASDIQAAVKDVNTAASKGFIDSIQSDLFNLKDKIQDGTDNMQKAIDDSLGSLIDTVEGANDIMTTLGNGINQTLDAVTFGAAELAAQCQYFCQLPASLLNNTSGRIDAFKNAISDIIEDVLNGTPDEKKNQAVTTQLTALSTFAGLTLSVISNNDIQTRIQAIEAAETLRTSFEDLTNALDGYGAEFDALLYHERYFSQTDTFSLLSDLTAKAQAYLLSLIVSLKKEKTVVLDKPLPAVFVALDYYNDDSDETLNFLIETNKLTLDEIMVIPAGRELLIYV